MQPSLNHTWNWSKTGKETNMKQHGLSFVKIINIVILPAMNPAHANLCISISLKNSLVHFGLFLTLWAKPDLTGEQLWGLRHRRRQIQYQEADNLQSGLNSRVFKRPRWKEEEQKVRRDMLFENWCAELHIWTQRGVFISEGSANGQPTRPVFIQPFRQGQPNQATALGFFLFVTKREALYCCLSPCIWS